MGKREKKLAWLWAGVFSLLCVLTLLFLQQFTQTGDGTYTYITWESTQQVGEDGSLSPAETDEYGQAAGMEDGGWYRFTAQVTDIPEDGLLILYTTGAQAVVRMDGEEMFRSSAAPSYGGEVLGEGQARIPLPPGAASCQVEVDFQVLEPEACMYPPMAQVTSTWLADGDTMGYANLYSIPTGAYALVFLLVCGLLLLGVSHGKPDWSLLVLALAAGLLTVHEISQGSGYYFLPEALNSLLSWRGFDYLIPLLLLGYLLLNRKRGFLRWLGAFSLCALALLALCAGASMLWGGAFSSYLREVGRQVSQGMYMELLTWATRYLVLASSTLSVLGLVRALGQLQAETRALQVRQQLAVESYQNILEQNQRTDLMRHEWKNQVTALRLMLGEKKLDALGARLSELEGTLDHLSPKTYTQHFAINAILQNSAAKAAAMGVAFHAQASIPAEVEIREEDLCALLLNMLDNALEAASQAEPKEVWCKLTLSQGFLAIQCENTFSGELKRDEKGRLLSTKREEGHGFGLSQMRAVAEKYHSVLDVSWEEGRFTVQTALKA